MEHMIFGRYSKKESRILRKLESLQDGKGRKEFEKDARGEVQTIRTLLVWVKVLQCLLISM